MNYIHNLLDKLASEYEAKGHHSLESLLPPVSSDQIQTMCTWFPSVVPESISSLYSWRGGQSKDAWGEKYPFWFRDMSFISLELAESEYQSMMESYGVDNSIEVDGVELKTSFPFAAFNGGWYVIPCSGSQHKWKDKYPSPVISVFQGVDMHYHSVPSMLNTCIEWVSGPKWSTSGGNEQDHNSELKVWKKHNPGLFER